MERLEGKNIVARSAKPANIIRYLRWVLPLLCLFLGTHFLLLRGKPERVFEDPPIGPFLAVRNGQFYWVSQDNQALIVHAIPIVGGNSRELDRQSLKEASLGQVIYTDTDLFYELDRKEQYTRQDLYCLRITDTNRQNS